MNQERQVWKTKSISLSDLSLNFIRKNTKSNYQYHTFDKIYRSGFYFEILIALSLKRA